MNTHITHMPDENYTARLTVNAPIHDVFNSINNIAAWWTDDLEGSSKKVNDEFTVRFDDIHVSTQKLIEFIPDKKIVWLVTDSNLNFVEKKDEWTNSTIIFELSEQHTKTQIDFTHVGLNPSIQCYNGCSQGWDHYIKGSLFNLLTEGKGNPGL